MIRLKIILESTEDVIREIEVDENNTLYDLHLDIINFFQLQEFEMASFYTVDENLNIKQEIKNPCFCNELYCKFSNSTNTNVS